MSPIDPSSSALGGALTALVIAAVKYGPALIRSNGRVKEKECEIRRKEMCEYLVSKELFNERTKHISERIDCLNTKMDQVITELNKFPRRRNDISDS